MSGWSSDRTFFTDERGNVYGPNGPTETVKFGQPVGHGPSLEGLRSAYNASKTGETSPE